MSLVSKPKAEMKVYVTDEQKALFELAAKRAKPLPVSATTWMVMAGLEKAERDGVTLEKKKGGGR